MNLKGTVSLLPNAKGDLYVQMGILRSLVNIRDLEMVEEASITGPGLSGTHTGGSPRIRKRKQQDQRCPSPSAYRRRST